MASPCIAFVKVNDTPLEPLRPIGSQLQALTLSLGGDNNGEDGVRSFFTQLQQLTKHLYAPVVRAAGQTIQVCSSNSSSSRSNCRVVFSSTTFNSFNNSIYKGLNF